MKICVIGNSHTDCVAAAWSEMQASYPEVSLTIHRNAGHYYDHFQADKNKNILTITDSWSKECIQKTSGGDGTIDFSQFDICLLIGGYKHKWPARVAQLGGQAKAGYSAQAIKAAAKDLFASAHGSLILPIIRQISDIPIYQFHDPFLAPPKGWSGAQLRHGFRYFDYQNGVDLMNKSVFNPLGGELISQPAETFLADSWTKFSLAAGFKEPFPAQVKSAVTGEMTEDRWHMLPEFGKIRLLDLFDKLGIKPGP